MLPQNKFYRFLEYIPGSLVWITFILAISLSFIKPLWVIYFIIVFDLFWVFRVAYFVLFVMLSWKKFRNSLRTDWHKKLQGKISDWDKYIHLIFLPTVSEPLEVLEGTLDSLIKSDYPSKKMVIVLAGEERKKDDFIKKADFVRSKYQHKFHRFIVTIHPANLPNEIPGKGSNLNYAGHQAKKWIDEAGYNYDNIIVSSFDIDTCVHPQYFSCLTYTYASTDSPTRASYQPVALYNNNIWESPAFMRIAAFSTTFWLLGELIRPDRLFTFSSHSMSFRALVDVGFWEKDIVTEDSRIFLQAYIRYDGNYRVVPIYLPVSMDTVMAGTFFNSLKNLYKQQRRWAWGVEHFPYMVWHFIKNKRIPKRKKIKYLWNITEGMYSWAVAPLLIFILGYLPLYLAKSTPQAVVYNAPYVLETLMQLAMAGIIISIIISLLLLPKPKKGHSKWHYIIMVFQWILLPLNLIVFGSIPAIEAQTRLMLGKYLGFNVTEKARKKN